MLLEFQKALVTELKEITSHMQFMDKKGNKTTLNVFEQVLPMEDAIIDSGTSISEDEFDEDALPVDEQLMPSGETEPFPYCIIRINDGEQADPWSPQYVYVDIIIGIYDGNRNVAYQGVLNVIQAFMERFYKNPSLDGRYRMRDKAGKSEIQWTIEEGTTISYFFGGIASIWELPAFRVEDNLS